MKTTSTILLALAALAASTAASTALAAPLEAGWYLGAGIGRASHAVSPGFPPDTRMDNQGNAYRLYGGYQFNRYLMLETAYIDLGSVKVDSPTEYARIKARAMTFGVIGMLPVWSGFSLTGKLGLASLNADAEAGTKSGSSRSESSATRATMLAGVGLRYTITPNITVRADYDHMQKTGIFARGGKLGNHMMSLGVDYRF
ncbi:outer membrane beta-barrel protein [Herbaspirillum sp. YR522]|uniref:outer membrane beta-barrel protein n=1 Tax=Herbaspirillum sp. YR522 TaxID=1144342 RepID=UPI00026F5C9A|nr:outer membrane beta-barrel protein [Herbaspirillum sp. YR522]EJN03746.1 opacity protein [Herbaspirillum sp. YR522]